MSFFRSTYAVNKGSLIEMAVERIMTAAMNLFTLAPAPQY
jgi:hypothetical protein